MPYLLGIDGGGTRTTCMASDQEGRILGEGYGGPSNHWKVGLYAAKSSLKAAIGGALRETGLRKSQISVLCAGLAGLARGIDRTIFTKVFSESFPECRLKLEDDAYIALVGATEGQPGVIVISGTGSIATGVNNEGRRARSGGWGHILGDEGSGYQIARSGLTATLRAEDGRGPATLLTEKICSELYIKGMHDLIPMLYDESVPPNRIASLFPLVVEAADEGDDVARGLLDDAAVKLYEIARAVILELGLDDEPFPIIGSGGVWNSAPLIKSRFEDLICENFPKIRLKTARRSPAEGAVMLARALAIGQDLFKPVDESVEEQH